MVVLKKTFLHLAKNVKEGWLCCDKLTDMENPIIFSLHCPPLVAQGGCYIGFWCDNAGIANLFCWYALWQYRLWSLMSIGTKPAILYCLLLLKDRNLSKNENFWFSTADFEIFYPITWLDKKSWVDVFNKVTVFIGDSYRLRWVYFVKICTNFVSLPYISNLF